MWEGEELGCAPIDDAEETVGSVADGRDEDVELRLNGINWKPCSLFVEEVDVEDELDMVEVDVERVDVDLKRVCAGDGWDGGVGNEVDREGIDDEVDGTNTGD